MSDDQDTMVPDLGSDEQDLQEESSSDDDSSSSGDDVAVAPADMELMMKLEAELEENQNLYDTHVKVWHPHTSS